MTGDEQLVVKWHVIVKDVAVEQRLTVARRLEDAVQAMLIAKDRSAFDSEIQNMRNEGIIK